MKLYTVTLFALLITVSTACARANSDWIEAKQHASLAIDAGECSKAWELMWPRAKRGNVEARAILATGMLAAGLSLPGGRNDAITRYRDSIILAVHGAAGGDAAATEMSLGLVQNTLVSDMGGAQFAACLKADTAPQSCVDSAIKNGFIPDFANYAREIDAVASAPGASKATCHIPGKAERSELPVPK
jgi:hypothetical protein